MTSAISMRTAALAIVVVILAASLGADYLNASSVLAVRDQTISSLKSHISSLQGVAPSTTTVTVVSTASPGTITIVRAVTATGSQWTNISSSGLELLVSMNTTRTVSGGAIAANVTLFNSLDKNLTLIPTYPAGSSISNCDFKPFWGTVGYALFSGYYTPANISSAGRPLNLIAPIPLIACTSTVPPDKFVLLPQSSVFAYPSPGQAVISAATKVCSSGMCFLGSSLFGYWDSMCCLGMGEATTSSTHFHYFSPGRYTLAVEDMWNQTIYAHFQVSQ